MTKERTRNPPLEAEAKKMQSLAPYTNGCISGLLKGFRILIEIQHIILVACWIKNNSTLKQTV